MGLPGSFTARHKACIDKAGMRVLQLDVELVLP
jgi:hypothetical protein